MDPRETLHQELLRTGVLASSHVREAFARVDRAVFVPESERAHAYDNRPLPIGWGQTISQPYTVAFMLDRLDPLPGDAVLDIGSGSGWQTALLADIVTKAAGGKVYAIERIPELCAYGRERINELGYLENGAVTMLCQDATADLPQSIRFDKIIAAAAAQERVPPRWLELLKPGGRLIAPVGDALVLYQKGADGGIEEKRFAGFHFVPLVSGGDAVRNRSHPADAVPVRRYPGFRFFGLVLAILVALGAVAAPVSLPADGVAIDIPSGVGSRRIGELLAERGIIRSKWAFVAYATVTGRRDRLRPGAYAFRGVITMPQVVELLARGGPDPEERIITIPEGWDQRDIGRYFSREAVMTAASWWDVVGYPAEDYRSSSRPSRPQDFSGEFPALADKPDYVGLEGYLYPDTYRIYRSAPPADIARRMLGNFERKLTDDLRAEIAARGKTIFDIITVASLLERESRDDAERALIAGILERRLAAGIPLQVDASVTYATGKSGSPTAADLAVDSPFNTYRSPGLPLGPIANPSIGSIRAAIYPKASRYLYYLHTPDGEIVFSETLEEHNAAKARFLLSGRE